MTGVPATGEGLLPTYDELEQACGELEAENVRLRKELNAAKQQLAQKAGG